MSVEIRIRGNRYVASTLQELDRILEMCKGWR